MVETQSIITTWHSQRSETRIKLDFEAHYLDKWKSSTASSAARMLGEIEESYVQSYIQTQSIGIACAEKMEDSVEQLRAEGNAGLSINPRAPGLCNVTSHCMRIKKAGIVRLTRFKVDKKMSGWIFIIVGWLFTDCQHTLMSKHHVKSGFCIMSAL